MKELKYIQPKLQNRFLGFFGTNGEKKAKPGRSVVTPKAPEEEQRRITEWTRQSQLARDLILKFQQNYGTVSQEIQQLIRDVFSDPYLRRLGFGMKSNIPLRELKETLADILLESVPKRKPEWVQILISKYGHPVIRVRSSLTPEEERFTPRQIIGLLEFYGLTDGQPKTAKQILATYKLLGTNQNMKFDIHSALQKIGQNKRVRRLVLES